MTKVIFLNSVNSKL